MTNITIENATGYWCKLLGAPVKGYDEGTFEWSMDLSLDNATIDGEPAIDVLKKMGLKDRIKNKDDSKGNFLHLKRNSVKKDGEPAKPIRVLDNQNNNWDQNKMIGNGSILNVQVVIDEYMAGKVKKYSARPLAVQVWSHEPFESKGSFKAKSDINEDSTSKEW